MSFAKELQVKANNKAIMFMDKLELLNNILTDANVNYVSQLINRPVEITLVDNRFKDFRILTEVI